VAAAGLTDNARGYSAVVGSSLTARGQSADKPIDVLEHASVTSTEANRRLRQDEPTPGLRTSMLEPRTRIIHLPVGWVEQTVLLVGLRSLNSRE
jgi:hypothetical protein